MEDEKIFYLSILAFFSNFVSIFGSGALSGKILLVRIIENNKIDANFSTCVRLSNG